MDVGAPLTYDAVPRLAAVARRLASPRYALTALVLLSSAIQTALAWRRASPGYFPDEYMYAELGRSLLESGTPLVRGESAHFLPLLYPLLTAPAWLWDEVELAYRSIQAFNAVAMSLAAIPVFLIARRLRVGDRLAVSAAALTVVLPELLYASATMAEAVAYPLALCTAAAAVAALERPLLRYQLALIAFAGLATLARLQLAILFLCFLVSVVAVGVRAGRLRQTLREQWLAAGVAGIGLATGSILALGGGLGIYGGVAAYSVDPAAAAKAFGANALVLVYAAGWVIVPGALIALALALARPQGPGELAFAVFTLAALLLLLLQSALVGDVGAVQERYVMYIVPLLICLFSLYARRGWPLLRIQALLAGVTAAAAAAVPLAGSAAGTDSTQSVVLASLRQLERVLGDVGLASLLFAAGATGLSAVVLLAAWRRPSVATVVALSMTVAISIGITSAAASLYEAKRAVARAAYLPHDPSWVDAAADGAVTLLVTPRSTRGDLHSTLFWNRSVRSLVLLGSDRPDAFAAPQARVDDGGRVLAGDAPVGGLVLVDLHGTTLLLRNAERIAAGPTKALWRTGEAAQVQLEMPGRYYSGLLAAEGSVRVWPDRRGGRLSAFLEFDLSAPGGVPAVPFHLELPNGREVAFSVPPRSTRRVRVPVCALGVWTAEYTTGSVAIVHGTRVGFRSSQPRLVDDAAACATPS